MGILEDLRDGKPCRWTGVCDEMSAVGGCTCGEAADEIARLRETLRLITEHPVEQSQQWETAAKEMIRLAVAATKDVK